MTSLSLKEKTVLGIDTSNYTTSLAVCRGGEITENIKLPLRVAQGSTGLRQSDAVFSHTVNLPQAFELLKTDSEAFCAVGCSTRPRNADGSYMPCFLSGETAARIISGIMKLPLYRTSHQEGHISAAVYSSKMPDFDRFYAYHLSGGTLELLLVGKTDTYDVEIVGKTLDITAGQAIDRTGVMLGLQFPCGAALEQLAGENEKKLPDMKVCVNGCTCNLSGLQNQTEKMLKDGESKSYIAAYTLGFITKTVDKMTENIMKREKLPLLFSGGVASNSALRNYFKDKYGAYFASPAFSSDNAAGVALLTYNKLDTLA